MIYLLLIAALLLIYGWSANLWFYKDRHTKPITPNVDNVFDRKALPIYLEYEEVMDCAVILVHGYPSTPYAYDWASKEIFDKGFDVFVPLLPGFGTEPKELYNTTFTQWYNYLESFYREKRNHYKYLFVIGTSMGGAMTLKLAENFGGTSKEPDGIALIGTPVFLNDFKLGAIQKWGYYFMRIVALFTPALKPKVHKGSDKINDGEENWIGYSGSFVRGGVSLMYNLKEIRANLHLVETPIYIAHDQNDKTISFQNLPVIKERVSSKNIKEKITNLKSNHNRHTLLMYPSIQQQLSDEIVAFFKAIYEEKER